MDKITALFLATVRFMIYTKGLKRKGYPYGTSETLTART